MQFLQSSRDFAGADAAGADVLSDDRAVFLDSHALDVSVPLSSGVSVGVGNVVAGYLALAANIALLGHFVNLLCTPKRVEIITFNAFRGGACDFRQVVFYHRRQC